MKKTYINPETTVVAMGITSHLMATSFDSSLGSQSVSLTNEEYNGAFTAKRHQNYVNWDEE